MKRIAIDGGPCGGKTTGLNYLSEKLSDYGISAIVSPEVATLVINSGLSPDALLKKSRKHYLDFQELLFLMCLDFEENIFGEALKIKGGSNQVLLADRGIMDIAAYMEHDEFLALLEKHHLSEIELRERYDAVIHLLTVADGRPELYTTANNSARREKTPEAAIAADKRTQKVWHGHPHFRVIDNSTLFRGKMKRLLKEVQKVLGIPVVTEIERKFLLKSRPLTLKIPTHYQKIDIVQAYLKGKGEGRVRRRSQDGRHVYYRTYKQEVTSTVRIENEERIGPLEYQDLFRNRLDRKRGVIRKSRYCFLHKNQYFELDEFIEPRHLQGMYMLEIELTEENDKVSPPPWLEKLKEVTDDPKYKNYNLAKTR